MFPCSNPVNPHMRDVTSRLQTFWKRLCTWPAHHIAATPKDMSQAGLYYLGERDRVKCWYCNGRLQNWDKYDNPWFEHAKWFPTCEYLLQKKGPEFVESVSSRFTNLDRPAIGNPAGLHAKGRKQARDLSTIIDPKETQRQLKKRVNEEMQTSPLSPEAKTMGFSDEEIKKSLS